MISDNKDMINNNFYESVKNILEEARTNAYSSINSHMVKAYWNIGRMIVEEQSGTDRAEYGEYILKEMSKKLTKDYGKGFGYSNLTRMRKLYLSFKNIDALRQQLSWTHYRLLMKVEELAKRDLEQGLIDNLQEFLLELGKGFSFVGRQRRITAEGEPFM